MLPQSECSTPLRSNFVFAFTVAPSPRFRYGSAMSEAAQPHPTPAERFRAAMKQILTVSKPEILRREAEDMKQRREKRQSKGS